MGVVYKLTPEVSSFIIEQKQNDPKITCQNLAGTVFLKFGQKVSKSSVHALLKQSHVITTRPRKNPKDKFQIPIEKKEEISKALAPFVAPRLSEVNSPQPSLLKREGEEIETPSLINEEEGGVELKETSVPASGRIFLQSALWDVSFKPILGLKDSSDIDDIQEDLKTKAEWKYLTRFIYAICIETRQGSIYIDPRFQGIHAQNPNQLSLAAPIERAACEMTDQILNNIRPLIIRGSSTNDDSIEKVYNFINILENNLEIRKISLIGANNRELVGFNAPLGYKRKFIIGVSSGHSEFQGLASDPREDFLGDVPNVETQNLSSLRVRILKKDDKIIITNMIAESYEEIWQEYLERHPSQILMNRQSARNDQECSLLDGIKEQALMFFPVEFSRTNLEEVLCFPGNQIVDDQRLKVELQSPASFNKLQNLKIAAENVNNLHIRDNKGRILCILIDG